MRNLFAVKPEGAGARSYVGLNEHADASLWLTVRGNGDGVGSTIRMTRVQLLDMASTIERALSGVDIDAVHRHRGVGLEQMLRDVA